MRLPHRLGLACSLALVLVRCGDDDAGHDDGGRARPDAGMDASTDAGLPGEGDAGRDAATTDAGSVDAADAGETVCVTELECTQDCIYEARDVDPDDDCGREGSYVYEGTCGDFRYRASGDEFGGRARYYRVDTGELVATLESSDTASACGHGDANRVIAGDVGVADGCDVPSFSPDNLCCLTDRAPYITFCEPGDAGS